MPKNKLTIAIDLDHTLINTAKIKFDLFALCKKFKVTKQQAKQAYEQCVVFTPKHFAFCLLRDKGSQVQFIQAFNALLSHNKGYQYEGVKEFLNKLSKSHKLILLSYGNKSYQQYKIRTAGLEKYFSQILIIQDVHKQAALQALKKLHQQQFLLLDDSAKACATAQVLGVDYIKVRHTHKNRDYYKKLLSQITHVNTISHSSSR